MAILPSSPARVVGQELPIPPTRDAADAKESLDSTESPSPTRRASILRTGRALTPPADDPNPAEPGPAPTPAPTTRPARRSVSFGRVLEAPAHPPFLYDRTPFVPRPTHADLVEVRRLKGLDADGPWDLEREARERLAERRRRAGEANREWAVGPQSKPLSPFAKPFHPAAQHAPPAHALPTPPVSPPPTRDIPYNLRPALAALPPAPAPARAPPPVYLLQAPASPSPAPHRLPPGLHAAHRPAPAPVRALWQPAPAPPAHPGWYPAAAYTGYAPPPAAPAGWAAPGWDATPGYAPAAWCGQVAPAAVAVAAGGYWGTWWEA